MADIVRELIVRLKAEGVGAYKAAMAEAGGATSSMGAKTQAGAAVASKAINGMAAVSGVAILAGAKMAATFNQTFAQIGSLAGKIGMPMDEAKAKVLDLAKATGQDPNGLASALYFAASAGLQANQVFPVLTASAQAAAIGMGDAQTVAQTLTSVLNAYKGTGLDTASVMNTMTAAVRDGKAEMSDFATGLGPIISVAAAAGVRFSDMAAALAEATNQGVPFSRAVTGLRFLVSALEAPTDKASKALESIGLSGTDVAKMLTQPGGLEHALQLIHDRTQAMGEDGRKAWSAITGGSRGALVAVDLVGKHAADTNRIVADLGRSAQKGAKDFSNAYSKISNTDAVKFQKAIADVKVALIQLGEKALPALTPIIRELGAVGSAVIPLAPMIIGLWAAFKGYTIVRAAATALGGFEVAAGSAGVVLAGATGVIAGAAGEVFLLVGAVKSAIDYHHRLAAEVVSETDAIFHGRDATSALADAKTHLAAVDALTATVTQVVAGETRSLTKGGYVPLAGAIQNVNDQQGVLNKAQDAATAKLKNLGAETVFTKVGMTGLAEAVGHAGGTVGDLATATKDATGPTDALGSSTRALAGEERRATAELGAAHQVLGKFPSTIEDAANAWTKWRTSTAQAINPMDSLLQGLESNTKITAAGIATAMDRSIASMKRFGQNIATITADGSAKSRAFAQYLISLGPAAFGMAAKVAGASKSVRDHIVNDFSKAQSASQQVAGGIEHALTGGFNRIAGAILIATGQAHSFADALAQLHDKTITITTHYVQIGSPPAGTPAGAHSTQIAAAAGFHGWVDRPTTLLVGEGGRPERVDVSPQGDGGGGDGGGVTMVFQGPVFGDRRAFERAVYDAYERADRMVGLRRGR